MLFVLVLFIFDSWPIIKVKVKVKIMQIAIVDISKLVTVGLQLSSNIN